METPVICHGCRSRFVARLGPELRCGCGSDDVDLDLAPRPAARSAAKAASQRQAGLLERLRELLVGAPPNELDQARDALAAEYQRRGLDFLGRPAGVDFGTVGKSSTASTSDVLVAGTDLSFPTASQPGGSSPSRFEVHDGVFVEAQDEVGAKIVEMANGVMRTNPSMDRRAALDLVVGTVERYPAIVQRVAADARWFDEETGQWVEGNPPGFDERMRDEMEKRERVPGQPNYERFLLDQTQDFQRRTH